MSVARFVPETWELSGDEARETLRRTGRGNDDPADRRRRRSVRRHAARRLRGVVRPNGPPVGLEVAAERLPRPREVAFLRHVVREEHLHVDLRRERAAGHTEVDLQRARAGGVVREVDEQHARECAVLPDAVCGRQRIVVIRCEVDDLRGV